eukprot:8644296-Pyramimonas_sp.AAC.1
MREDPIHRRWVLLMLCVRADATRLNYVSYVVFILIWELSLDGVAGFTSCHPLTRGELSHFTRCALCAWCVHLCNWVSYDIVGVSSFIFDSARVKSPVEGDTLMNVGVEKWHAADG